MDLFKIISDIEKVDPEVYERFDSRRRVFKYLSGFGKTLTAAALPTVVGGLFTKAYGQGTALAPAIVEVLNLALSLEYLERYFYQTALDTPGLLPADAVPAITTIRNDEVGHIGVLRTALGSQAIPDPTRAAFDYTGGRGSNSGPFANVFRDFATFITVAQSFVDTGVRAYKGGAPILMPNKAVLQAALNIHSVEARHSSKVRALRRGGPQSTTAPKSWITNDEGYSAAPTNIGLRVYGPGVPVASFPTEANITQAGINVQTTSNISLTAATESFDEPLDPATVKGIARNFVVASSTLFV
jgi:hypothetical protein